MTHDEAYKLKPGDEIKITEHGIKSFTKDKRYIFTDFNGSFVMVEEDDKGRSNGIHHECCTKVIKRIAQEATRGRGISLRK
jgi:hypothetical protein